MNKKLLTAAFAALAFFGCSDDDDDCEVCASSTSGGSTNVVKEGTGTVYTAAQTVSYVTQNDSTFLKINDAYCDYDYGATGLEFTWYEDDWAEDGTYYLYSIANDSLYLTYAYYDCQDEDCETGVIEVDADYSTLYYGENTSIEGYWKDLGIEIEEGEYTQYLSAYLTDVEFTADSVYTHLYASDNYPYGAISMIEDALEVAFDVWPDVELDDDYNVVVDGDEDWFSVFDVSDDSLTMTIYGDTVGLKWAYAANSAEYGYEYTLTGNGTSCNNFYWHAYISDRAENCNLEGYATRYRYNDTEFADCAQNVLSSTNELLGYDDDYYDKTADVNKLEKARVAFTKAVDSQLRAAKRKK